MLYHRSPFTSISQIRAAVDGMIVQDYYRSVELAQGWNRYLYNETFHNDLDGISIIIAFGILNLSHPGFIWPRRTNWKGYHHSVSFPPQQGRETFQRHL